MSEKDTLILAIESSCDETAASVVKNGRCVLSNIISSQIAIHTLYGGVGIIKCGFSIAVSFNIF